MSDTRLLRALRALLPQVFPREPFLGPRRYRVVSMRPSVASGELVRAELQIVQAARGLPDMLVISMWPGVAGYSSNLQPGAHVLVQFIDGDREQPYVCAFSAPDDPAWRPIATTIDASSIIAIGASANELDLGAADGVVVREGDTISITPGNGSGVVTGKITITTGLGTPPAKSKVKA